MGAIVPKGLYWYCLLLAFGLPARATAQFEVHVHHEFPGVCGGDITVLGSGFDQVVWSTGDEGPTLFAPPGMYGFTIYDNGAVVLEGEREIGSNGWDAQIQVLPLFDGIQLSGPVSVAHCGTAIFEAPCCTPDPAQTSFEVRQDGVLYTPQQCLGCSNIQCAYNLIMVSGLPYGHEYSWSINDQACAGVTQVGEVTAHSCANLELEMEVVDAIGGGNTGSITVLGAIPDPTEPLPIEAPVLGDFRLFDNASGEPVGELQTGGAASWEALPPGEYLLAFVPDQLCRTANRTITITDGAMIGERTSDPLDLRPNIADDHVVVPSSLGLAPVDLRIVDLHGRVVMVLGGVPPGRVPVGELAPGQYVLIADRGGDVFRARFIKR
ncbi:MAG TPA: T9SS type A sorting domain-containing protein [Flavobacteriales bacterium]|nr:T9SS type A sorting domain-containing protein [Flavobacteriales bacterium]